ncbi:hypothetical protein F4819DRAFT_505858 [Hypoxylon fuscum]|nr:hypothetical protein F4819DRAFT_505858 [Hypoxylon fuscum]
MDSAKFPPESSPELPMINMWQENLVNQIDNGDTYEEMYPTIVEMATHLDVQSFENQMKLNKVLDAFTDDESSIQMKLLLHTIPRPVLRSIVMRMAAHDFWERDSENRQLLYDKEGPGAYLLTVSVLGRDGCTWSNAENQILIGHLQAYQTAIDAVEAKDIDPSVGDDEWTADEVEAYRIATEIDNALVRRDQDEASQHDEASQPSDSFGTEDSASTAPSHVGETREMPRFASSSASNKSRFVSKLITMLQMRHGPLDSVDVICKQSLSMVGNEDDMEKRWQNHHMIGTASLTNSNKLWALTASCLKYMHLEPNEIILPILKAWNVKQINLAEILLTVLAGSFVTVGGLNIEEPGTKSERKPPHEEDFDGCRLHVWKAKPWFHENLAHSYPITVRSVEAARELEDLPTAEQLLQMCENINKSRQDFLGADWIASQTRSGITAEIAKVEQAEQEAIAALGDPEDDLMSAFEDPEEMTMSHRSRS